jgi:eukaryotic-like serine/threonine-protein kinase
VEQESPFDIGGILPAGTKLRGIYVIDAPLAKGGMGELYRGRTIETGDAVAIKLIRSDLATNEAALDLFRKEASALSRLHHEAIVRYYVFSKDPDLKRHFLAMELVEGQSLSELLKRGPLPSADVDQLRQRLALGLQAAHERGIIHRDVSPDNVIVQDGDLEHARIIDFGIARSTRGGDGTIIGSGFAGKYNYVSPEQLGLYGGDVSAKSDIYSLALVLVQCLRGSPINMGGTQAEIIEKRRTIPDLSDIDASIRPLLSKMLEPDPARRPPSMSAIAAAMRADASHAAGPRAAIRKRSGDGSGRPMRWAIAAIFGTALIGAVAFILWLQIGEPGLETVKGPSVTLDSQRPAIVQTETASDRIIQYIRHYDGGNCFLALPTAIQPNSAAINGFGTDASAFQSFNDAFLKVMGFEPEIDFRRVTPSQCPTLAFLARVGTNTERSPKLAIAQANLKSGDVLEGWLQSNAASVQLLVIDDEGLAHDVSNRLVAAGDRRSFAMQFKRPPEGPAKPMLLVAVASAAPVSALKISAPAPSAELLPIALAQDSSHSLATAFVYFKLE